MNLLNMSAVRLPISFAAKNAQFVSNFPQGPDELWMSVQKNIAIFAVLGTVTLAACGSKTDANEKNFGVAMRLD
ncbi:hypothetical protein [Mycoavidus cysteinexigens]|nr:hypothetical protein [Mycoavidus cysteinexigens]GAM52505.1 hypothetical protein EBME_0968 [bacterium endosymbiont of Mortierella elongata FMR23-6]